MTDFKNDINFDRYHKRFDRKVYQSGKGYVRLEVLKHDLLHNIPALKAESELQILDAGAGMGQISAWLAGLGHRVVAADISSEMLEKAKTCFNQNGVGDKITIVQSPIQELAKKLSGQKFDLILLHGVVTWMQQPFLAIDSLMPLLKDDSIVSLLYFNRDKLILKWGISDEVKRAINGKSRRKGSLTPINPLSFAQVAEFCQIRRLKILSKAGVRVFYGFFATFPEKIRSSQQDYLELELKYCDIEPYASLGEHTHLLLSRA
ncbi:MAG: methyltransferase domain-containing protein [Candidatus Rifleibacteriota bacterium]